MDEKIAYMIMAHRDPEHLYSLITALDFKADIYIYIDGKSNIDKFKEKVGRKTNIIFISQRERICWAGMSQVRPIFRMLHEVLKKNYCRVVFLTGADYPLYSSSELYRILTEKPYTEYICGSKLTEEGNEKYMSKVTKRWYYDIWCRNPFFLRCIRKGINTLLKLMPKRKPYVEIDGVKCDVYYGYAYWAISMPCAKYLLDVVKRNKKLYRYFLFSFAPIELYCHTIIFNSVYKDRSFYIRAYNESDCMGYAPLHYVSYGVDGSRVLNMDDYDTLKRSSKIFCQKVDSIISRDLINQLNENKL